MQSYIVSVTPAAANVLLGNEWLKLSASRSIDCGDQATLNLAAAADVYLIIDDRWVVAPATRPAWLPAEWTDTGWNADVFEKDDPTNHLKDMLPFSVYKRSYAGGTVSLPKIGTNTAFNYVVVVD